MFKSIFAKYISAFILIIFFSFAVIISIITSIINNYSQSSKEETLMSAAQAAQVSIQTQMEISGADTPEQLLALHPVAVSNAIGSVSSNAEDITVIIADETGKILHSAGSEEGRFQTGQPMNADIIGYFSDNDDLLRLDKKSGIFDEPHIVYALPINSGGSVCGEVFVCSSALILTDLLEVIVKTIILAILWVMLAALIAVYFISERIIAPLRAISDAAKSFASGRFDVRVPVRGHDEVAELALAFNNMAEDLDNYEKMRNSFISNVSHDLRTPMTSIAGFIDGILDGVIPPEQHRHYLQIVSVEVGRLSRLVASLLNLSRIQAGERKFVMEPFDICEMSRQILFSFEKKINDKQLDVSFDFDEENITAIADRDATYQVLYNICDNAVKFSETGGLLRISIEKYKNRRYLVSIYNEGQGIPPDDLPHIFERFYKSDKSRGLDKSGVGLGMFISKTIMDAHNEEIWVESDHGKNCTFKFTVKGQ